VNYAHIANGNQDILGAGINYAHKVEGSQFALFYCAVNIAKEVGKGQYGMINIATEKLEGTQLGIINYGPRYGKYRQFGLLNIRPGKRWWNPEISLFYHRNK
jgi:hypothetical protein